MKKTIAVVLFLFTAVLSFTQDYQKTYLDLLKKGEMEKLLKHLQAWEKAEPKNPELYIGYFNYYLNKARTFAIAFTKDKPRKTDMLFELKDPDSDEVVGFMSDAVNYEPKSVELAFHSINLGLAIAPNRLDMHFGKARLYAEIRDYKRQAACLVVVLEYSRKIDDKWLWDNGEALEDGKEVVLGSVQEYITEWLDDYSVETRQVVITVAGKMVAVYPQDVRGYNNLAGVYGSAGDHREALKWLLEAEKVAPNDYLVSANLGFCYEMLKDKKKAIKYYKKALAADDKAIREWAERRLSGLK